MNVYGFLLYKDCYVKTYWLLKLSLCSFVITNCCEKKIWWLVSYMATVTCRVTVTSFVLFCY